MKIIRVEETLLRNVNREILGSRDQILVGVADVITVVVDKILVKKVYKDIGNFSNLRTLLL